MNLNTDNREREFAGLTDALRTYRLSEGMVVTLSQEDWFEIDNFKIEVVPAFRF